MELKKSILACITMGIIVTFILSANVFAGLEPPDPSKNEEIVGPTMWAVVVVDCTTKSAVIRIKSIDGCTVETQALSESSLVGLINGVVNCVTDPNDYIYARFFANEVLGIPCQAIITKIKNFVNDGTYASFDCQLMFISDGSTACVAP